MVTRRYAVIWWLKDSELENIQAFPTIKRARAYFDSLLPDYGGEVLKYRALIRLADCLCMMSSGKQN